MYNLLIKDKNMIYLKSSMEGDIMYRFYNFARKIITFFMKACYRVEYIGLENIPENGAFILAGNHKNNLDCFLIISSTKRVVRFMAKAELMKKFGWIMKKMAIIPVDRSKKNKEAMEEAEKVLQNGGVIGIFPEGTFNKTEYVVRPFKYGCVKMSSVTNAKIVPFAIINDYKLFRKSVKVIFGNAYNVQNKDDLKKENIILMNKVIKLLRRKTNAK